MTHPTDQPTPTGADARIEHLDPGDLLLDRNVRADARVDRDFVASIRDLGVLVPIVAVRTGEGAVRVRYGHRRVIAALEAERVSVPVLVAADESTDDAAEVERLVSQYAENEHRIGLSTAERVAVVEQLAAFGVSAAKIAKRTRMPRAQVDAALSIAGSELAKAAAARYSDFLDLVQAATVAEFSDDPEAVKSLIAAAKTGQFAHTAQRLRDERAQQQQRGEVEAALRAAGVTVIPAAPGWQDKAKALSSLRSPGADVLTADNHRDCPGHAAYVATAWGWLDPATGTPVSAEVDLYDEVDDFDEEAGDDDSGEDPGGGAGIGPNADAGPDDQERSGPQPVRGSYAVARYVCQDPKAHGHVDRYGYDTGRKTAAEMTDSEREAARAERRDVIESNKQWTSAETVRRDWLRAFVSRKTAPKRWAGFVAAALATDPELVAQTGANHLLADLLGCPETSYGRNRAVAELVAEAAEPRAQLLALALVLTGYEHNTGRHHWRHVQPPTARYFRFLASQGYALSDVERRACGADPLSPDQQPQ